MAETTWDYLLKINQRRAKYGDKFKSTFGTSIQNFWDIQTGFDVVEFDRWLLTPDGVSSAEHVENKYGTDAAELVRAMIQS